MSRFEPTHRPSPIPPPAVRRLRRSLEALYGRLNRPESISPDPLELVVGCADPGDREVVGLLAATLAYGRVAQILRSARSVLAVLGPRPAHRLATWSPARLEERLGTFVHRFTTADELLALLRGIRRARKRHGSLEAAFVRHLHDSDRTVVPALDGFVGELCGDDGACNSLLSRPFRGSACKRLHLFLRWMVRHDAVDPGGWTTIRPDQLVVPLDTHMHRIARALGLTARKAGDLATALEVTEAFRLVRPDDPVRYDFALTRLGIRADEDPAIFLREIGREEAA